MNTSTESVLKKIIYFYGQTNRDGAANDRFFLRYETRLKPEFPVL